MKFQIGDLVTRNSYRNDIIFIIIDYYNKQYILKGTNDRLTADAYEDDLKLFLDEDIEEKEFEERIKPNRIERNEYFFLPGKILHIDSDKDYLSRCMKYYEQQNIWAMGIEMKEKDVKDNINELLEKYKPNIVVITGHDAYYKKSDKSYSNSDYYSDAIKVARTYENSHDKLIIIAGGCQSNYEKLIQSGANFASSPKRVNIHALDPAILASSMSMAEVGKDIDLKQILSLTKYGPAGMGGIKTKGTMYVGYPR